MGSHERQNVFVDGDPPAARPRRGRGRVVPITTLPPSSIRSSRPSLSSPPVSFPGSPPAQTDGRPAAARFTRPHGPRVFRADRPAGRRLQRLATRRYRPLLALATIVVLLLVGLAVTNSGARGRPLAARQAAVLSGWQARARNDEQQLTTVTGELHSARQQLAVARDRPRHRR